MKLSEKPKVVEGTVYGLFPERSREIYENCIVELAGERKVDLSSTLDSKVTDIAEQVWKNIHTAEVVMADITGYDLQVMCEIGMALALKDPKKLVLLCSEMAFGEQEAKLPLDLRRLEIHQYDDEDFGQIRQDLSTSLNKSLQKNAPAKPIEDLDVQRLVDKAIKNTRNKDYEVARILFEQADEQLPDHWYIHMQWAVMLREKGDSPKAREYFRMAESETEFDEQKAEVYIEQAILEFHNKEASKAEGLFERAKSTDKKNRRLYIVWADVMDQLGWPERALGRVTDLMETVGRDDETALLTQYYSNKLNSQAFTMSLEEFRRRRQVAETPPSRPQSRSIPRPQNRVTTYRSQSGAKHVPDKITWHDFKREYQGRVVKGIVKNVHAGFGVFVYLGNFKGLMHKKHLGNDFQREYRSGNKVDVRVSRCYTRHDGVEGIELVPT